MVPSLRSSFLLFLLSFVACSADMPPELPEGQPAPSGPDHGPVGPSDPGRVTLRRLSRLEYDNTVRDLTGTTLRPAEQFPADDIAHGFDNNGDALSLSPLHLFMYQRAAEAIAEEAVRPGNPQRARLFVCQPITGRDQLCTRRILEAFARRAWRRPVTGEELDRLNALAAEAQEQGFEQGIALGLQAVLLSPHFLFRVELDPDPASLAPHRLTDHELAARLSYFLWSSTPDDTLLALADAGRLGRENELRAQVARMLDSTRSAALLDGFVTQWLQLGKLSAFMPDPGLYPDLDDELRQAMRTETRLFLQEFLSPGGPPAERLLTADFTYLNGRLARHYGLPFAGSGFRRVLLRGGVRGGLLTQGSLLAGTSLPTRTSPVKRGKWVLEQLLCSDVPPPPPGVEGLPGADDSPGTLRQRLEEHRRKPACASCHSLMDPIGLALENFDAIGAFRGEDQGEPIDASGVLPDGTPIRGPRELAAALARDSRFGRCLVQKLYTYALGRTPTPDDQERITQMTMQSSHSGHRLRELITGIVLSDAFRSRRGEPVQESNP
jgi:hypothetical protein